ncbi:MAG: hypothetical protein CVU11_16505 [Bacteroidetes bacterium HGW-Bacteroidetes-6]|jgi:hypothetical protein|nr:MAG: hypothetical protein CVU11_16505 [Bacteroidetes bacterium HGW-Bacteroidetes-6]
MKKTIVFLALLISFSIITKATDIQVNETGSMGAYTSITAALAAAVDGDRIFVEPKAGGLPYIESFTISKSVQILCNTESSKFAVQGNISITPATVEEISIIGMELTGNITSTIDASTAGRTIFRIFYSTLTGHIAFENNNYDITVANCTLNGYVSLRSGRVIGNIISSDMFHGVYVGDEASGGAVALSDTIQIIGNRITCIANSAYYPIDIVSQDYFYQIRNNYLYYAGRGIFISGWTSNLSGSHEIINNSFKRSSTNATNYAIYLSGITASGVLKIYNNLFDGYINGTSYGIYLISMSNGIVFISYNYFDSGFSYYINGATDDGTNSTSVSFTIDITTGQPTSGSYANLGHPDMMYYDLDLTRNDVGCYGGSLSARNFFPTGDANHNRVYMLSLPSSVYSGNPIRVKAESFDK